MFCNRSSHRRSLDNNLAIKTISSPRTALQNPPTEQYSRKLFRSKRNSFPVETSSNSVTKRGVCDRVRDDTGTAHRRVVNSEEERYWDGYRRSFRKLLVVSKLGRKNIEPQKAIRIYSAQPKVFLDSPYERKIFHDDTARCDCFDC